MQGWRASMEDKHKHLLNFDNRSWKLWSYFAIFDGHNGKMNFSRFFSKNVLFKGIDTAKKAADHLDIHLLEAMNGMLSLQDASTVKNGEPVRSSQLDLDKLRAAIKQTYFELDKDLKNMIKDDSGCVCVRCLSFDCYQV